MSLVLVLDDSAYMRGKVSSIVREGGHEVIEAEDGLKGLQRIVSDNPDCVVLDIIMPVMDGLKLLHAVKREKNLKLPMVVVTADIQESTRRQCIELGAVAVLNKPPKRDELLAVLEDVLKQGGARS